MKDYSRVVPKVESSWMNNIIEDQYDWDSPPLFEQVQHKRLRGTMYTDPSV